MQTVSFWVFAQTTYIYLTVMAPSVDSLKRKLDPFCWFYQYAKYDYAAKLTDISDRLEVVIESNLICMCD